MAGLRTRASYVVTRCNNTSIPCGEEIMLKATIMFAVGLCANVLIGLPAMAQAPAEVTLTRIDCGTGATPTVGIVDRLKELRVTPEQVKYVGISHFHGDHTGQLAPFTNATLLIGKGDWDQITSPTPMQGANVAGFKSWIDEKRKVEPLALDKDVFGDGSVIVLRTPGHTPGHSSLLVRLKEMGPVLLTGDLVHFRENYESGGVPWFNFDRAATVASIERMKQIVANLKATVVIQHDMRDIAKLPAFPAAAK